MIDVNGLETLRLADEWLDAKVSETYKSQPLAQDWARVSKVLEELGEAISELILWTGQNPRKQGVRFSRENMLAELADTAMTAMLAIQHFTKDPEETDAIMDTSRLKIHGRAWKAGYR